MCIHSQSMYMYTTTIDYSVELTHIHSLEEFVVEYGHLLGQIVR